MSKAESVINIGIPVLWMVDPANPASALGVIYEFSVTRERVTVWYTEDGYPDPKARLIRPEDLSHDARS